jgi:adenosine deaminase
MRYFDASFSPYYNALCSVHKHEPLTKVHSMATLALVNAAVEAKNNHNLPIVAIDIAGAEAGHPAKQHTEAFMLAQRNFIYKTYEFHLLDRKAISREMLMLGWVAGYCSVHAGEDYGPESIFQAITDLHAERIGHGYHIFSHELVDPHKVAQGLNPVKYVQELANYATNRCESPVVRQPPALPPAPSKHTLIRAWLSRPPTLQAHCVRGVPDQQSANDAVAAE